MFFFYIKKHPLDKPTNPVSTVQHGTHQRGTAPCFAGRLPHRQPREKSGGGSGEEPLDRQSAREDPLPTAARLRETTETSFGAVTPDCECDHVRGQYRPCVRS